MEVISVFDLKKMMDDGQPFQLIDVREVHEFEEAHIEGAELIPMGEVMDHLDRIRKDVPVVVVCRSGGRSGVISLMLEQDFNYPNIHNLQGGMVAWAKDIDPSLSV
jgi:sulfur-carrier protein adenylyltransferase/sulfurtransferase